MNRKARGVNVNDRDPAKGKRRGRRRGAPMFLFAPTMQALLLALSAGPAWGAGPAFGAGWFAEKRATQAQTAATGRLPGGGLAGIPSTLRDQQRANEQLRRSLANLSRGAAAIAAQQAAQAAARQAAMNQAAQVPDGLAEGGLKVDANPLTAGWMNARPLAAASQAQVNGRTVVTVEQTGDKAVLNWETFNVGRNTTVSFQQQSTWSVLNRVNDPRARPSQIQGQINASGTVMLVNRNGVVFSGSSQVNVRNLVAAAVGMSDDQFRKGLYSDRTGTGAAERFTPSFGNDLVGLGDTARAGNATGDVRVEAGARIQTTAPGSVTQGGGYVLLLGREAHNAGQISTPGGQTALAAGDSFIIRRGLASDANTLSTTRGNEISARRNAGSQAGLAVNTGLIQSPVGDITLTGHDVRQSGVAVSSTSVTARGTIHLLNSASDPTGSILLGQGSTTAILLQDDDTTALDAQRDAAVRPPADGLADNYRQAGQAFDHLSALPDRRDQSRIEVTSGGTVQVQDGAMALATGGQVSMSAARRTQLDDGAILDVAGAVGVKVSMESNNLKVNIQGNELRDAPVNREGKTLNNDNIWIDRRTLVQVPKGVNGYEKERWYTAGGLLEVGGYLGTSGHAIGEWAAIGGTVTVEGGELVARKGSLINISGGTLDVASGYINQSWLRGEDGRLYEVSRAPGDLLYKGLYRGFEETHARWGANATRYFYNALLAPARRYEDGYTAGRDAGRLVIGTRSAVVEGSIVGEAFQGERQAQARQIVDTGLRQQNGYQQSQLARALAGQLVVGRYVANQLTTNGVTAWGYDLAAAARQVAFTDADAPLADTLALDDALPAARRDTVWLDATALSGLGLGQITAVASDTVSVRRGLTVATGGTIELYGPRVDIQADLTARGGRLAAGNVLQGVVRDTVLAPAANASASVMVAPGATLDTRGLWVNLLRDPAAADVAAYRNGGQIELRSTGAVAVAAGAVLDAGSGATRRIDGKLTGGKGGDITLEMARPDGSAPGPGQTGGMLDGEVRSYGVQGGGTLRLSSGQILIDDRADAPVPPGGLLLRSDLFASGFSRYDLNGDFGMAVADGTVLRVTMPVYRSKSAGPDPAAATLADALERWTPPLFQEDPRTARMSQRLGASLSLSAFASTNVRPEGTLRIGQGAVVEVDPGQTLRLQSRGQMTLRGTLRAPGGQIVVARGADPSTDVQAGGLPNSVWLDSQARLDVAGIAVTALDMRGRRYGLQRDGGRIAIDGEFLVIRPGAVLDASGTSMVVDVTQDDGAGTGPRLVGGNGGEISLSAMAGLYLDGLMRAAAGAPGVAGGKLALTLDTPLYGPGTPDSMLRPRELTVAQVGGSGPLPGDAAPGDAVLTYGYGRIGVDQITAGAFDDVSLFARDLLTFDGDVTLAAGHAISLREGALGNTRAGATVRIAAPYVLLDGRSRHAPLVQQPVNATLNDWAPSAQAGAALLRVEADHIDIRNRVNTGMNGTALLNNGGRLVVDRRGYDNVALYSRGDLRFLPAAQAADTRLGGISNASAFLTAGDLSLAAQRIYPATGSVGLAVAGWRGSGVYDNQRVLRVERVNGPLATSAPLSALGSLILNAPTVEQGGVLYAPLGNIRLGLQTDGQNQAVKLLAGSLTSVSAAGLTIPFGGTTDGLSYLYQGVPVEAIGVGGMAFQNLARGVSLAGGAVTVEAGAVIDLSGGGILAGAAFVSGRGGSTDPLFHPLPRFDGASGRFDLPSLGDRPVYAILPGLPDSYAPVAPRDSTAGYAGSLPRAGETITLGADIPGLPAGTYTLLPAYYALLPGAFRVELGQEGALAGNAQSLRGGSWSVSAIRGLSHTGTLDAMPRQALVTPGGVLRRHAQYNEMDYRAFVLADAARRGQPRPMLPADAAALELYYRDPPAAAAGPALRFEGLARFDRGEGGYGGQLVVRSNGGAVEIVNASPTAGFSGISLRDGDLNAIGASRMSIGGWTYQPVRGDDLRLATRTLGGSDVYLRSGATLRAPEVMLIAPDARAILIEQGGVINTLGMGSAPYDSRQGYQYSGTGGNNLLAVSNGWLDFPAGSGAASGRIELAVCPSGVCGGTAQLYSDGTIAFGANNLVLHDALRYGTRNLVVGASSLNAGSDADLADATVRGVLPGGLRLSQALLRRLLDGDTSVGAPALERVIFSLRDSINFFGSVSLSTLDAATGKSSLAQLVLNTPALYGYGTAADVALLSTDTLVWNGVANGLPGEIADGGAGTGLGTLNLRARRIVLGDANGTPQVPHQVMARQAVGFGNVIFDAAERITTGGEGSLEIYRSRGSFVDGKFQYEGGDLLMRTPLLTGAAGSVARLTTGGALRLAGTGTTAADADAPWGATLTLQGDRVDLDSVITLPSGKLTVQSEHTLTLGENSRLDLAGRAVALRDQTRYGWGGDVELESRKDNILQAPGAVVDLSARYNQGGRLTAIALDAAAGLIDLRGTFRGQASGEYDAGGTLVPFDAAGVALRAQAIADFTGLNQRLNQGGVTGSRAFQLKRGDLTVGNDIKARHVNITVDNGSLIVNGAIDASGAQVGSIRLAALNDLVINGLLDAHGTLLRVDSRGAIIDSPNRAVVTLTSTQGRLRLDAGAAFDLRAGTAVANGIGPGLNDGRARGTLDLNARRINQDDVALDLAGTPAIAGAERVYVNAFRRYDDAPLATAPDVTGRTPQVITQDYLDLIDRDSVAYMNASLANAALHARLGGFRLRPGVEIVSATADGDLTVSGDLDLSAYRYGPDADRLDPARRGFGEAGLLLVRAKGDLNIHGSITDGFTPPLGTDDDSRAWRLVGRAGMDNSSGKDLWGQSLILPRAVTLRGGPGGTVFPTTDRESLNFDLPIAANTIKPNVRLPVQVELADTLTLGAGTVLAADVMAADGTRYAKGSVLQQALTLAPGARLGAGLAVGQAIAVRALTLPRGTPLSIFGAPLALSADLPLAAGAYLPAGTDLQFRDISVDLRDLDANGIQGKIWAVAPMLPAGTSSWSLRLAGGADLDASDTRALRPLSQQDGRGNLTLADLHYMQDLSYGLLGESPIFSVIRTGRGDLDLLAGGSFRQGSYYGIYTAGTPSDSVRDTQGIPVRDALGRDAYNLPRAYDDLVTQIEGYGSVLGSAGAAYEPLVTGDQYAAWYPEGGGNLFMTVQGDMSGAIRGMPARPAEFDPRGAALVPGSYPANWLWRQGGAGLGQQTAWWINFGTYVPSPFFSTFYTGGASVQGFMGIGTLGGGNLSVNVGGDAGVLKPQLMTDSAVYPTGQGLVLAVGSTGRVTPDGRLISTGGGDLELRVGGALNPLKTNRSDASGDIRGPSTDLNGVVTNLRGALALEARSIGRIDPLYNVADASDVRGLDPLRPTLAAPSGGLALVTGDSAARLDTLGDLVLGGVGDAGRILQTTASPFILNGADQAGGAFSWYTLWTSRTAVDLWSAGGALTPISAPNVDGAAIRDTPQSTTNSYGNVYTYPSRFSAVAATGSIYFHPNAAEASSEWVFAPGTDGRLEMLAGDGLYGGGYGVNPSGAALTTLATPQRPAYTASWNGALATAGNAISAEGALFAFGRDNAGGRPAAEGAGTIRFYAGGDIVGLRTGAALAFGSGTEYRAARPVSVQAGRDIVNLRGLFLNQAENDISQVYAGRDILHANVDVAGPGWLEVAAGRNLAQEDKGRLTSLGMIDGRQTTGKGGAGIVASAGGEGDYAAFARRYLDPANRADPSQPLASQSGKTVKTYEGELLAWLHAQHGYDGGADQARAYFDALPAAQQRVFLRQVYYTELTAGGREYNDPTGPRAGSYARGRQAIAELYPATGADGQPIHYQGDLTLFGGSGIQTLYGGSIHLMAPGGQMVFGVEGVAPPATAGIITQGAGDIQMYAKGSILLGQSRVMTTFGGNILGWSAEGDINSGRGSKSTVVYTPQRRLYDDVGNITLSPTVPSTGAGIATLDPIPEVPPGDVDLVAPLGTIDAGEAGIRFSGNVNLAALQVVNAANVVGQGKATGVPTLAAVNVAALTSASAAAAGATQGAQETTRQQQAAARRNLPSIISVQILGYGSEPVSGAGAPGASAPVGGNPPAGAAATQGYDPRSIFQMVGNGELDAAQKTRLTEPEQRGLAGG